MSLMHLRVAVALALATLAAAHGNIVSYTINGVDYPAW